LTDDLRPKSHLPAILTTAIAVGGAVWGGSAWLHSRAEKTDVTTLTNNTFLIRLEMEGMKGEQKASNIRLERLEKMAETQQRQEDRRERRGR
jgi:hypothetical protein